MEKQRKLAALQVEQQRLKEQENAILEALKKIKSQKMALEVEQMQLSSMIREAEKDEFKTESEKKEISQEMTLQPVDVESLDVAQSSVNTARLDLSVVDSQDDLSQDSEEETEGEFTDDDRVNIIDLQFY